MRSTPSSWSTFWTSLGFVRKRRKQRRKPCRTRRSRLESLEDRRMLSVANGFDDKFDEQPVAISFAKPEYVITGAGPLVAAARAIAGNAIDRVAIGIEGFRFTNLNSYRDPDFLSGIVKYGDLPALLALSAPHPLWIGGELDETPNLVTAAYRASSAEAKLATSTDGSDDIVMDAVKWILEK